MKQKIFECPQCLSEKTKKTFNTTLSKPRMEFLCKDCGLNWHYSKQGRAVDIQGNYLPCRD